MYTYIYIHINAIVYVPSEPSQKSNFVGQISVIISVAFQVLSSTDHMTRPSGRKQDSMSPSQCQASIGWTQGGEEGGMVGPSAEKSPWPQMFFCLFAMGKNWIVSGFTHLLSKIYPTKICPTSNNYNGALASAPVLSTTSDPITYCFTCSCIDPR